jgi:hypothetical protein
VPNHAMLCLLLFAVRKYLSNLLHILQGYIRIEIYPTVGSGLPASRGDSTPRWINFNDVPYFKLL